MTCIVGLVNNERVYIGADSCATSGNRKRTYSESKVFIKDDFIFGVAGSIRVQQILQHKFNIPVNQYGENNIKFLCSDFAEELIKCFKNNGVVKTEGGIDKLDGSNILMGYRGHLYAIYTDFQILETTDEFFCVGSGEHFANGAMKALMSESIIECPEKLIVKSLEISSYFCNNVSSPFVVKFI